MPDQHATSSTSRQDAERIRTLEAALLDAIHLLAEHQQAHGFAKEHADPRDSIAQQWRMRRDALLDKWQWRGEDLSKW